MSDLPRILVVDDTVVNRVLVRSILREYEVVEAGSAEEAFAALEAGPIDLVLLDVMMPGMDGYQACRAIKERTAAEDRFLPVLLVTALGDQEHRNHGFESGADDFITKPFDRRELSLRVRAFLRIREQQDTIQRQLVELRRLDRLKDDLAALIVHDLRNPLAGVDGFLRMMYRKDDPDTDHEMVDWALMAARNLRDTVEDMLKVRLMEESQLQLAIRRQSVRRLAEEAADSLRGEATLRELSIGVDGDDIEAEVDEHLLRRALENLLANALRYTRRGTGVLIHVEPGRPMLAVDVADNGPGIPDRLKPALFEKYGSVEAGKGESRRGTGLGLYLVRLAAEAHGGSVHALDRPGGGTIFRISLPAG